MSMGVQPHGQALPPTYEGSPIIRAGVWYQRQRLQTPTCETRAEYHSTVETIFYRTLDLAKKLSVPNTAKKKS